MLRRAQQGAPIGPGHHNRASRRARAHVLDVTRRACAPTLEERDELGKRPAERDHPHGGAAGWSLTETRLSRIAPGTAR